MNADERGKELRAKNKKKKTTEAQRHGEPESQKAGKPEKNRLITNFTNGRISRIIPAIC
jgi:hypothetical protein